MVSSGGDGVLVAAVEELDEVVDGEGSQVGRLGVVDDLRGESRGNHDGMVGPWLAAMLVHIGDLKGVDSPVTPSFHFDNDVFRGSDLHVGVTPSLDPVGGTPQLGEGLRDKFLELLVSSSVCAGRTELVSEVGSWSVVFVVFVVDGVDTLAGIGQVGDGGLDRLLPGELVEALVGDSGKPLGTVGLVVADELVEFLDVDVDLLDISEEGHVLPRALFVPPAVVDVVLPEVLRKVRVVPQLKDLTPRDELSIMVDEDDVVALDVPPRTVYRGPPNVDEILVRCGPKQFEVILIEIGLDVVNRMSVSDEPLVVLESVVATSGENHDPSHVILIISLRSQIVDLSKR